MLVFKAGFYVFFLHIMFLLTGRYKDEAHYKCVAGYQVDTGIEDDNRVLLNYTFTCGANNDWTDAFSPQQCVKQNCGDPGEFVQNINFPTWFSYKYGYIALASLTKVMCLVNTSEDDGKITQ